MTMKAIVVGLFACTSLLAYEATESEAEPTTITDEPDDSATDSEVTRPAEGQAEPARKFIGCWKDEGGDTATCCDLEDNGTISCTTGPILRG